MSMMRVRVISMPVAGGSPHIPWRSDLLPQLVHSPPVPAKSAACIASYGYFKDKLGAECRGGVPGYDAADGDPPTPPEPADVERHGTVSQVLHSHACIDELQQSLRISARGEQDPLLPLARFAK